MGAGAQRTVLIGLSGGIGSGKSTVARIFERLGALVVDADAIVHELQAPGTPLLADIAAAFGPGVIRADGSLDRQALADVVFRDEQARQKLNAIVHPAVGVEFARHIAAARAAGVEVVVCDIPLLFEGRASGSRGAAALPFDATVLVWVPEAVQIERTVSRDGCTREQALRRVRAQMALDEKRALADHVVDNSGPVEETERQVREIYAEITAAAA